MQVYLYIIVLQSLVMATMKITEPGHPHVSEAHDRLQEIQDVLLAWDASLSTMGGRTPTPTDRHWRTVTRMRTLRAIPRRHVPRWQYEYRVKVWRIDDDHGDHDLGDTKVYSREPAEAALLGLGVLGLAQPEHGLADLLFQCQPRAFMDPAEPLNPNGWMFTVDGLLRVVVTDTGGRASIEVVDAPPPTSR